MKIFTIELSKWEMTNGKLRTVETKTVEIVAESAEAAIRGIEGEWHSKSTKSSREVEPESEQEIEIEDDSIKSVKELVSKIETKIKESSKENKKAWRGFLKQCNKFLTIERKKFSEFISNARTALKMDDGILEMLNQWGENKKIAQAIISGNWELWKIFAKNRQKKNPELKERYNFVGEYYTSYSLGTKTVAKYLRQFVKKYASLYGAKFSIRADRDSINISFTQLNESCQHLVGEIADEIKEEASKFNFDDSDGMTDYFHNFFYCFVQRGLYSTTLV